MGKIKLCVVCHWQEVGENYSDIKPENILAGFKLCKTHEEEQVELKFGKFKGQSISDVAKSDEGKGYLKWLRNSTEEKIDDPKYGKNNRALIAEIDGVLRAIPTKSEPIINNRTPYKPIEVPKSSAAGAIEKKIDFLTALMQKAYPDAYNELVNEQAQLAADNDLPF